MASLIAPLAAGLNGAPSGTAYIYQRGTTTNSGKVWADADVSVSISPPVSLDSNGRAIVYVTESVTVRVTDSTGALVTQFVWEDSAPSVEVRNAGFTGTGTQAQQVAGGRTTLDVILTSLYSSLGATDGKVLIGTAGQNLRDAIGSSTGIFYNVKASAYGAKGDGATDDRNSIQSAINAAVNAGGGIVYFPPGTYLIKGTLTISSALVQLMGITSTACIIRQSNSATTSLNISGSTVFISNLQFDQNSTTSNALIVSGADCYIARCSFPNVGGSTGNIQTSGTSHVYLYGCDTTLVNSTDEWLSVAGGSVIEVNGGRLSVGAAISPMIVYTGSGAGFVYLTGVHVTSAGLAASTAAFVDNNANLNVTFNGCQFAATGGGTLNLMVASSVAIVAEVGCTLGTNVAYGAWPSVAQYRTSRAKQTTGTSPYTPDALNYGYHELTCSTNPATNIANPTTTPSGSGHFLTLAIKATNAGGSQVTWGSAFIGGPNTNLAQNQGVTYRFVYDVTSGHWFHVCTSGTYNP